MRAASHAGVRRRRRAAVSVPSPSPASPWPSRSSTASPPAVRRHGRSSAGATVPNRPVPPFGNAGYWAVADGLQTRLDPRWDERARPLQRQRGRLRDDGQRARAADAQRARASGPPRPVAQRPPCAHPRAGAGAAARLHRPTARRARPRASQAAHAGLDGGDDRRDRRRARGVRHRDHRRPRACLAGAAGAASARVHVAADRRPDPQRRALALLALAGRCAQPVQLVRARARRGRHGHRAAVRAGDGDAAAPRPLPARHPRTGPPGARATSARACASTICPPTH